MGKQRRKIVKRRHQVLVTLLYPFFALFFRLRFNYHYKRLRLKKGEPAIILCNHVTNLDPLFVSLAVNRHVYYVASDQIFNKGFVSALLKFFLAPIPKSKGKSDLECVIEITNVLKQGGVVGIFAEGNCTFTGETCSIPGAIAKLLKLCRVPVIIFNTHGGYLTRPRFSSKLRRGKMWCEERARLSPDEMRAMSEQELFDKISEYMHVNSNDDIKKEKIRYKSKHSAEYLEHVFYCCPDCKQIATMKSQGQYVTCMNCGYQVRYDEYGVLTKTEGEATVSSIKEWYENENEYLVKNKVWNQDGWCVSDKDIILYDSTVKEKKTPIGQGVFTLNKEGFTLKYFEKGEEKQFVLPLSEVSESAAHKKCFVQIYTKDGKVYVVETPENVSALKYVTISHMIKNDVEGNDNGFLGL